jgi:hypothetical protein
MREMGEPQIHEGVGGQVAATPITGYRKLTEAEIALMNEVKAKAEEVGILVDRLAHTEGLGQRWVSIGRTDLQTGFMALVRAVAQPTTF